jgi:hypothetical protein
MGGIHLYLVLNGVGGVLGLLFVLNAVGALVLAVAIVALRRRPLLVASVLSLLFIVGTLLALVLALTIGLFGIRETLDFQLVPTTLVVELIGTIVLVPKSGSRHATCTYSCRRPPRRSRRSGRIVAVDGGGVRPAGGC